MVNAASTLLNPVMAVNIRVEIEEEDAKVIGIAMGLSNPLSPDDLETYCINTINEKFQSLGLKTLEE